MTTITLTGERNEGRATINGRRAYFGSVAAYEKQYRGNDIAAMTRAVTRAVERRHEVFWIILDATVICADKGFYEQDRAKWANAVDVGVGEVVRIIDPLGSVERVVVPAPNGNFRLVTEEEASR